ncbi:uncharacterized protein TRUGW13939_09581 [Talaromyces rugulosus]|uniref:Myb-like domain-containing protein n=1 Tax=Talaromyces rugulosus TaxID=121627 RepID=A0A7H8R7R0_TALRU|nr:uncharacterized protein TRUGW13939_09581 [Talaromyces rugulosus]QKX62420.1 hypothetical protein TRUGW13939_09581 [Talaromyces rugulosus]
MVKWTPELEGKFLSVVLRKLDIHVSGENWAQIASDLGDGFTAKACRRPSTAHSCYPSIFIYTAISSTISCKHTIKATMPVKWTKAVESRYLSVVLKQINARVSGEDWTNIYLILLSIYLSLLPLLSQSHFAIMSGGRWTDALDKKLLLKYISINATGPRNWDKVAAAMGLASPLRLATNSSSSRLHFAKILKDGESDAGAATPDGSGATPSTTAGKKRKAATATTDGGKSPSKQPQKRQRKTAAKDKGKSKDEDEDDEDSPFVKKEIKDEESEALDSDEA